MTEPLISNPLFHEYRGLLRTWALACFQPLYPRLSNVFFSNSPPYLYFLPRSVAPGYMNAGQRVSGGRAVGHACLSWMPFLWVKKRAADSVAPGNTAHFGYGGASRWVHLYLRPHRCFGVLLEMTMATLAWGGFTLFYLFLFMFAWNLWWLYSGHCLHEDVSRFKSRTTCSEIKKTAWEKLKTHDYIRWLHRRFSHFI